MTEKIVRVGDRLAVPLPDEVVVSLRLVEGEELLLACDAENQVLVVSPDLPNLTPVSIAQIGIDRVFARQVDRFINFYRSALEALAQA